MRIIGGSDPNKAEHWANHFMDCPTVKLDGVTIQHVMEADETAGFVVVVVYDSSGRLQLAPNGEEILTKRINGKVEIVGPTAPWKA